MSSLLTLKPEEAELLSLIGDTLIPRDERIPYSFSDLVLDCEVDRILYYTRNPNIINGFRGLIRVLNILPVFKYFRTFRALSEDERREFLRNMEKSKWAWKRHIILSLKSLIMLVYYHHSKVKEHLNFEMKCK